MQIDFSADGFDFATSVGYERAVGDGEPIVLCGVPLVVEQTRDVDDDGGTGNVLWAGGVQLARELERGVARDELTRRLLLAEMDPRDGRRKEEDHLRSAPRAIELGAGCAGLPGVVLALRFGMRVTLTEHPLMIPTLTRNLESIKAQVNALAGAGSIDEDAVNAVNAIEIRALDWGDDDALAELAGGPGYQLVVWADAGYRGDNALLLRAAIACVSPCGGIVLACEALRSETVTRTFRRRFGECGLFVVEILGEGGDSSETWTFTMRWQRKAEGIKAREAMASKRYVSKRVMRDEDEGSWGWGSE